MTKIIEVNGKHPELDQFTMGCYDHKTDTIYIYEKNLMFELVMKHELLHAKHHKEHHWFRYIYAIAEKRVLYLFLGVAFTSAFLGAFLEIEWLVYSFFFFSIPFAVKGSFDYWEERRTYKEIHKKVLKESHVD